MSQNEPLAELGDQIRAATLAAERLVSEAGGRPAGGRGGLRSEPRYTARGGGTPPRGWQQPGAGDAPSELAALAHLLAVLRELLPVELQQQVTDLIRQLLVLMAALIDWALTRLEHGSPGPEGALEDEVEVEDIPIA